MPRNRMARRRLIQFGLGGVAGLVANPLPLFGVRKAMADTPETTVYVSNAGSKDIHVLAMNRATGALDPIEKMAVPGTDKPSPASLPMAMSPDKKFLYAQLRSEPYPVSTFSVDPASGKLTLLATTPLVDQMAYLNVDHQGKFLLCASYTGGKLAIYPINDQHLVEGKATQILDTKPKAHCVYVGAGDNIYVPVLGDDEVLELKLDPAAGTVKPNGPGKVATKSGAGPRHFTIHPNGKWAYLLTETTATIGTYAIAADGTLSEIEFVDTADYKEQPAASDIHMTPDGMFLYGAERKTSSLYGFKIDQDKGTLTAIGKFDTEKTPRGFAIDPRGKFLLAVGMDSGTMTVHAIDPASGALSAVGHYPMGTQPNWVEIVDLKG